MESAAKSGATRQRRPKGSVSVSLETVYFTIRQALFMTEAERWLPRNGNPLVNLQSLFEQIDQNPEIQKQIAARLEYLAHEAVFYTSMAPIFDKIRKTKSSAAALHAAYSIVRLKWVAEGRLQPDRASPTDNDEILDEAIPIACGNADFRARMERLLDQSDDHFWDYIYEQLPDCRYEYQRSKSLYRRQQKIMSMLEAECREV